MKRLIFLAMAFISIAQPALSMSKPNKAEILELVGVATIITRAAKLCPQYEFSTVEVFNPTINMAKELVGAKAVDNKIDSINTLIRTALANGLKSTFCDIAKNSDAEMESSSK